MKAQLPIANGQSPMCRALAWLLIGALAIGNFSLAPAATLTGTFINRNGTPYSLGTVRFRPKPNATVLLSSGELGVGADYDFTTTTNGVLTAEVIAGIYYVFPGNTASFTVDVPDDDETYTISSRITNSLATYQTGIGAAVAVPLASATASGRVFTDVTDLTDPTVYLVASVDTLLAAKVTAAGGTLTGGTLAGSTYFSGANEGDVSLTGDFMAALNGSLSTDPVFAPRLKSVQTAYQLTNTPVSMASLFGTVDVMEFQQGSGGGGQFRLTLASGKTVTTTGRYLPATSATYCWERLVGSEFDIRDYGAVSGGSSNCRNAIQMAINTAYAAGGGTVVIPPGDYRFTAPYIEFLPGVNLRGDGGVLWYSLPDSYNRAADLATGYGSSRAIVLTESWVTSTSTTITGYTNTAYTTPWNGKGSLFVNAENSVWSGVVIDGGWGANGYYTRPAGVIPVLGVSSPSGGGSSDEFSYYQMISVAENSSFQNCAFYNAPGSIFSSPRYVSITGCTFTDYGDHILYVRAGSGATDADFVTFIGNHVNAVRAQVGTAGTYPYTGTAPSTNFVSATVRDALKIQNSQNVSISGNTMLSADATFLTLECFPRTDNTSTNSWIDTANITVSDNVFTGHRFVFLLSSRRNNAGAVATIPALPAGQKLKNVSLSHNIVKLAAATNWNGGGAKFISMTETPANGQDYGAALDTFKVEGNQVTGNFVNVLIGNPEYLVGFTNVVFQENQFFTDATGGLFQFGGRVDRLVIDDNILFQTDAQNTGSATPLRSFDSREFFGGEFTLRNNSALNYSTWLWENLSSVTAAYNNVTTYTYGTTVFDDHTLTNRSIVRASGGAVYVNVMAATGGGDPSTNALWAALTYPTLNLVVAENYKRMISTNTLTATERCGLLTYFYSPASEQMKYIARVTHAGNVNVGIYGDTSAYGLSSPPDVSTHVVNDKPAFDIPSPLEPMGYVDVSNSRIGFGYNFTTPATTVDVQANEFLFGADNGAPTTRTASTTKTARFNSPAYAATSASAGTRVSGFEMQNASSYSSFTVGANSSSVYLPTVFSVRLGSTITTAGNTASRDALYADGNLRVAINGTTFSGSEKLNVNGAALVNGALQATTVELGHASDTTLARVSAGVVSAEGVTLINTAGAAPTFTTLTDGATITVTCDATKTSQNATVTLGGNRTLAISGAVNGMTGVLIVKQDGTGARTLTLPASSKVVSGGAGAVALTATASAIDIISWVYDGTNYLWTYGKNFN